MMGVLSRTEEIGVCTGAACRAWDSEKVAEHLDRGERLCRGKRLRVCRVGCLNRCGGGVSVRVASRDVLKFRQPEEAARIFSPERTGYAPALIG